MDAKNPIPNTKLIAFTIIGAIGVTVILIADFAHTIIHKGLEQIRMIGWF